MKKLFILLTAVIICAGLSAGCNSGEGAFDSSGNMAAPRMEAPEEYWLETEYEYADDGADVIMELTSGGTTALPAERKIIRDAEITMEVEDAEAAYESILAFLSGLGGYEASRSMNTSSANRYYSLANTATLKVPAANLDKFLAGLKDEGEVISSNISSADITDQYFDSQIKLTTLELTLENYFKFLEEAANVDEQLRITRFINDITREIESLKGSLRRWDSLVDYSTVVLYIYRPYEAPIPEREIKWDSLSLEDMGWFISSGFLGLVNFIFSALQWIIIALLVMSPVIVPVAALLFLLIRRHKKKQKKDLQKKQEENINA